MNTFLVRDLTAPFGGVGISGLGREGGDYALDFYSDLETLQIKEGSVGRVAFAAWRGAGPSSWATARGPYETETTRRGFAARLRDSLSRSRRALTEQISAIAFDPEDSESWERLEEALLAATSASRRRRSS